MEIKSPHYGPITWLDVDSAEERYLLTGEFVCCTVNDTYVVVMFFKGTGVDLASTDLLIYYCCSTVFCRDSV